MSERAVELVRQARRLEHCPEQVALLEEAVREADAAGDIRLGYDARLELISAGVFGGSQEKAIVAFSWCLARYDETPEDYSDYQLFWRYKWVMNALADFPAISLKQIADLQADMERRYQQLGYSLRPAYYFRSDNARRMGQLEEALTYHEKWRRAPRDWMADCAACEQSHLVQFLGHFQRDEEAVVAAEPIMSGAMSCSVVPHATYGHTIRPLLRLNRIEEAREAYRVGYRLVTRSGDFVDTIAEHLLLLTAISDTAKAVRVFERHLPRAIATNNLHDRFQFYNSSALFLEKLGQNSTRQRKLNLPSQLPCYEKECKYSPAELAHWFKEQTQQLADQFNRRNGNEYYNEIIAESRELTGLE